MNRPGVVFFSCTWLVWSLLAGQAKGDLTATFVTSRGNIAVSLQYESAPQAVANFIGLAQGTRPWIDHTTGAVRKQPYYDGNVIHRSANSANFKFAQGGSRTGDGSDGPGYVFRDEFTMDQLHTPYVLSMANSGPHTNGGQFFFTGSLPQPTYDGVHTVFGRITDPAGRAVVDAMIAAGANGTTIHQITFDRDDPGALAFDEHAQNLPTCSGTEGTLRVLPNLESVWNLTQPQPAGSVFRAVGSADLQVWSSIFEVYQGPEGSGFDGYKFDNATRRRAFYQTSLVSYPEPMAPTSLANRLLLVNLPDDQAFVFKFDSSGTSGLALYTGNPDILTLITGVSYSADAYSAVFVIRTLLYDRLRIRAGFDSDDGQSVIGTHRIDQEVEDESGFFWNPVGFGTLQLADPE